MQRWLWADMGIWSVKSSYKRAACERQEGNYVEDMVLWWDRIYERCACIF